VALSSGFSAPNRSSIRTPGTKRIRAWVTWSNGALSPWTMIVGHALPDRIDIGHGVSE